jgi:ribosomal protein S18 acetylase RimI-like enzyme
VTGAHSAIRAFEERDVDAVRALWARTEGLGHGPGDDAPAIARFLARNPGVSAVAVDPDGTIVGAVLCGHDGRRGFVYRLAVAPERRRAGIARALMDHALAALAAERIPRCMLFVLADNDGGTGFWDAVGAHPREELRLRSIDLPRSTGTARE